MPSTTVITKYQDVKLQTQPNCMKNFATTSFWKRLLTALTAGGSREAEMATPTKEPVLPPRMEKATPAPEGMAMRMPTHRLRVIPRACISDVGHASVLPHAAPALLTTAVSKPNKKPETNGIFDELCEWLLNNIYFEAGVEANLPQSIQSDRPMSSFFTPSTHRSLFWMTTPNTQPRMGPCNNATCMVLNKWINEWMNVEWIVNEWMNECKCEWIKNEIVNECMNVNVNEWMYISNSEWMNVNLNEWMNGWVNVNVNEWMNEWKCEWMKMWMNEIVNTWMNEWMNECEWMDAWKCVNEWMHTWMNE